MGYIDKLPAMDLMRSEKMTPVQLIIPVESARRAVSYLGQLGLLQFRDVFVYGIFRDVPSDITIEVTGGTFALHKPSLWKSLWFDQDVWPHVLQAML